MTGPMCETVETAATLDEFVSILRDLVSRLRHDGADVPAAKQRTPAALQRGRAQSSDRT